MSFNKEDSWSAAEGSSFGELSATNVFSHTETAEGYLACPTLHSPTTLLLHSPEEVFRSQGQEIIDGDRVEEQEASPIMTRPSNDRDTKGIHPFSKVGIARVETSRKC